MLPAVTAQRGVAPMAALVEEPEEHEEHEEDTSMDDDKDSDGEATVEEQATLSGGPPWGFVFEGGAEFNCSLVIAYIQPDSVAAKSGLLQVGDQILGVGQTTTNNCHALTLQLIRATQPGHSLTLQLLRRRRKWPILPSPNNDKENVTDAAEAPQQVLIRSPSASSLQSIESTASQSSAASLPDNLLSKSVGTLQRNCPARRSEVMLSTLVRKLQDSLPRRNSERHQHHPIIGAAPGHAVAPPMSEFGGRHCPIDSNCNFYSQQPGQQQQQPQPKVKKALVSSFSFSLGRAPRPSGISNGGQASIAVSSANSGQTSTPVPLHAQHDRVSPAHHVETLRSPVMVSPDVSRVPNGVYPGNGSLNMDASGGYDLSTPSSLRYSEPQSFSNLHLHQIHPQAAYTHQPNLNGHQRISASVANLSKSTPYVGAAWNANCHSNTFAIENPLDCDNSNNGLGRPGLSVGHPAPKHPPPPVSNLHQFASCDQLNSNAMLLQPSSNYQLSRGVKSPVTTTITETFHQTPRLDEENDVSQDLMPNQRFSVRMSQSFDKISPTDMAQRVTWVSPSRPDTAPTRPASLIANDLAPEAEKRLQSSASFGNYARCIPPRRLTDKTNPSQAAIVRHQPLSNNKRNFGSGAVIVGRPPTRVSPQYGSNHQLYYRDNTATSPPESSVDITASTYLATKSSPSVGLLDVQRGDRSPWNCSESATDSPPQLPPRRYAIEEIRDYIAATSNSPTPLANGGLSHVPEVGPDDADLEASNVDDNDYADQLRFQSRSLIAAAGKDKSPIDKTQPPIKPFLREPYPRQVALIAPLLTTSSPDKPGEETEASRKARTDSRSTPRKVVEIQDNTLPSANNSNADQSIVSVQLPPQDMANGQYASATISRFYRRLLVRANSDVICKSRVSVTPPPVSDSQSKNASSGKLGSQRRPSPSGQPQMAKSGHSYFCDIDALASSSLSSGDDGLKAQPAASGSTSPLITNIMDGCIMEPMEDGDSAFAEMSPGASHSSNSSSSGRRGNASARSTGTNSLQSATGGTTSAPVAVVTTGNGSHCKSNQVQIALFTKQRRLLADEVRCDSALRILTREALSSTEVESILQLGSSSVGQYLHQVAAASTNSLDSPSMTSCQASTEALADDATEEPPDLSAMLETTRSALGRKSAMLKDELERAERNLSELKSQRRELIDEQLAATLRDIDDEALERLRSRLDELEMGALLAVRVASRAARLSPSAGKGSSREWRMAVEKLDDVRDVIDSLRQRIAGALSSKMLLTAISDQDLAEIATFINLFGQGLFEFHELSELVLIAGQQLEAFEALQATLATAAVGSCNAGSVTVVVD